MKIAIQHDGPDWAFGKRAACYAAYPPEGWEVVCVKDTDSGSRGYDGVLLLDCRGSAAGFRGARVARMIASHAWLHHPSEDFRARGVNHSRCREALDDVLCKTDVVACYNQAQAEVCRTIVPHVVLAPYCPDPKVFYPTKRKPGRKLRVGWCYQTGGGLNSFKGLCDVLIPLIAEVGNEVDWSVLTPEAKSCLNTTELRRWYQSLDVFLCTSSGEGGPQGPFEAALCGAVIVSTDVGQVSDWKALRDLGLIVPTYSNAQESRQSADAMAGILRGLMGRRLEISRLLRSDLLENYNPEAECPRQLREMFDA